MSLIPPSIPSLFLGTILTLVMLSAPQQASPAFAGLFDYEWFATTSPGSTVRASDLKNGFAINHPVFRPGEGVNGYVYTKATMCGEVLEYSDYARDWWNNWTSEGNGVILEKNRKYVCILH